MPRRSPGSARRSGWACYGRATACRPEARLAEDLGISPVTLRNALTILREAGLLETQRGRVGGTSVAAGAEAASFVADRTLPTEAELRDLADFRTVVEGGAAALAAERASATQLDELRRLATEMEAVNDFGSWSERDTLFHLILADASGSPRVIEQVAGIRAEVYRVSQVLPTPGPGARARERGAPPDPAGARVAQGGEGPERDGVPRRVDAGALARARPRRATSELSAATGADQPAADRLCAA